MKSEKIFVYLKLSRLRSSVENMPAKRTRQQTTKGATVSKVESFVVLRDEKSSRHAVFARERLVFAKKDNLKIGTFASFNGDVSLVSKCRGIVVLAGKSSKKN